MGWVAGERNLFFYADDVRIAGRYHEWVQDALTVTVAMFRQIGLETNLKKNKVMVCIPRFIWGMWRGLAYTRRATGEGETFREWKKKRVSCNA